MAVFRPTSKTCELNFDDKFIYTLPLHEDTADAIDKAMQKLQTVAPKDRAGVDEAYNAALDVIDDILGEGAGADVMSIYEHPGTLEVWEVLGFIFGEWTSAYEAATNKLATTVKPAAKPAAKPLHHKGGRR